MEMRAQKTRRLEVSRDLQKSEGGLRIFHMELGEERFQVSLGHSVKEIWLLHEFCNYDPSIGWLLGLPERSNLLFFYSLVE